MRRPSRTSRHLIVAAAAALALGACAAGQPPDPDGYGEINTDNEGYYGNFMFGCTGVQANDDGEYVDVKLEQPDFCTCVYRGMSETVPFEDAKALHEKLQKESVGGFDAEEHEEFEDDEGNVYYKKTYEDLKRQQII